MGDDGLSIREISAASGVNEATLRMWETRHGFPAPTRFVWLDSPFAASWAVALLIEPHHPVWREQLNAARRSTKASRATASRPRGKRASATGLRASSRPRLTSSFAPLIFIGRPPRAATSSGRIASPTFTGRSHRCSSQAPARSTRASSSWARRRWRFPSRSSSAPG